MTEKLKYKVGDKVLVELEIDRVDDTDYPYRLIYTEIDECVTWMSESKLDRIAVHLPPKPKIPQAVMDWYKNWKDIYPYIADYFKHASTDVKQWLYNDMRNEHALATLIAYGPEAVEVEKEKLYKVKVKKVATGNNYLIKNEGVGHFIFSGDRQLDGYTYKFTKQELIDAGFEGVFDNEMFEVEEVE